MNRVLVTGAAGFIGSNLVLELARRNFEVVALDNLQTGQWQNLREFSGEKLEWDIAESSPEVGPFDYIFHHGDITDPRFPNDEVVYQRNIAGFTHVLGKALREKASLIYASTAGLYGNGSVPMHEDQPKQLISAYGKSKLEMDRLGSEAADQIRVVGLRYFNVFGPRESHKGRAASMVYHLSQQMRQGKRPRLFEYGEQKRDFIYVKDVVAANLCAMKAPSGVYNVGTGVGSTFNHLVECLNGSLGLSLDPDYFKNPYDSQTYQVHTVADVQKAREVLGFESEWPLQASVDDYMEWLSNHQ